MPASADPELAAQLAREAQRIYSAAVAEMLERVARRLATGIDDPGWAEAKLADVVRLRAETTRALALVEGEVATAVTTALDEAYGTGQAKATAELAGGFSRTSGRSLDALIRATVENLTATHSAILRTTLDRYRLIISDATTRLAIGAETRRQATQRALDAFARAGITGFRDRAGRQWEIETYAEMAIRTAAGRAAVAGSLDRYADRGIDLVIVSNAPEECHICRPWEGKILSISGDSRGTTEDGRPVAGTVDEARGKGLLHSNCRHSLGAYIPGLTKVPISTSDVEGDKLRQRQRTLERQVRAAKRQVAGEVAFCGQLKTEPAGLDVASAARLRHARATQSAATKRLATFTEQNDRKRLRYREKV